MIDLFRPARSNRQRKTRRGAAAVEFAISITILLMIVFASIEFVRLNMLRQGVEHASYMAARRGIVTGATASEVQAVAEAHLSLLGVSGATVTVDPLKITDETKIVRVDVIVPTTGNTWVSPVHYSGNIAGRSRMLAERAAADMTSAMATP